VHVLDKDSRQVNCDYLFVNFIVCKVNIEKCTRVLTKMCEHSGFHMPQPSSKNSNLYISEY